MTHGPTEHDHPHPKYHLVFIALIICTLLSVAFDVIELSKPVTTVLVLAVAVAKAQYVMRYFMHLKFEGKWKYVLLLPTAILACGIPLALTPDIAMHYYTVEPSQAAQTTGHEAEETGNEAAANQH